ncbi:hypothetical protein [Sphingomonas sp. RB1R13]|uniref:hypothetical protein n=1 Tax=Sphingomonas sp. RB1R13 TaxID=3096159 RepID=UPI002FC8E265
MKAGSSNSACDPIANISRAWEYRLGSEGGHNQIDFAISYLDWLLRFGVGRSSS